jgi:hypothetical protein
LYHAEKEGYFVSKFGYDPQIVPALNRTILATPNIKAVIDLNAPLSAATCRVEFGTGFSTPETGAQREDCSLLPTSKTVSPLPPRHLANILRWAKRLGVWWFYLVTCARKRRTSG